MNSNQDRPWVVSESIRQRLQTVVDAANQELRVTHSCVPGLEVNVAGSTGRSMSPSDPTAIQMAQLTDSLAESLRELVKGILLRENATRPINALPEELFWQIFDLLPVSTLLIASKVCYLWRNSLLERARSWRELKIEYGECDEVAATVWPWVITCLQIHPTTNRPTYARTKYYNIDNISRKDATLHERSHSYIWFAALMLKRLEMKLNSESIQNARTAQEIIGPIQLVFLSLITWSIPESVVELPSVRYLQICARSGESENEPDLARLARLCPNLNHLALERSDELFKIDVLYEPEPTFHRLTISAPGFPYGCATLGIDLTLVPHLHIQCDFLKNLDAMNLLEGLFSGIAEIHINSGADCTIEGRAEDGRTFICANIFSVPGCSTYRRFNVEMAVDFLSRTLCTEPIVLMEIMDYHVRGATDDGREFVWMQLEHPDYFLLGPLFAEVKTLTVDAERLAGFREHVTMPNLVSLSVEFGEVASHSVLRALFGVGDPSHRLKWPTPKLKELTLVSKGTASRQPESDGVVRRTIEKSQLEHFVGYYLSIPQSGLNILQLVGIIIAEPADHVSSLDSVIQDASRLVNDWTPTPPPLVQPVDPDHNTSAHFVDVTAFYQYFRSENRDDLAMLEHFDLDASDDSDYEPDPDNETLMSSDSENDYESDDSELTESDAGVSDEDVYDPEEARSTSEEALEEEASEQDELSENDSEAELALEIEETRQAAGGQSREAERGRRDFLPEGTLPSIQPFVTTFPGRQFKQLIVQPE